MDIEDNSEVGVINKKWRSANVWFSRQFSLILLVSQLVFILLYGFLTEYDAAVQPTFTTVRPPHLHHTHNRSAYTEAPGHHGTLPTTSTPSTSNHTEMDKFTKVYPMFQDVHVMIFVGFGFLMTFLRSYAYSAVGFTLLLGAYVIQWSCLVRGFFRLKSNSITLGIEEMVQGDFCAASILISMGAVLGKLSPSQYVVMSFFEVVFYAINEYVVTEKLEIADIGGSMVIHTFGAYFGLTVSRVLHRPGQLTSKHEKASYFDDLFSILGTIFLWLFWPSFNGALAADPNDSHRTVINTYCSLAACCLVAFAFSTLINHENKLDMVHIQNATLAGGVAIGAASNCALSPCGSLVVGSFAGGISVLGYKFLMPFLRDKHKLHDTCGVNNLHGMPGIFGGLIAILMSSVATYDVYEGDRLTGIFYGRHNRSSGTQAGFQLAGLLVTLGFAVVSGIITGFILKLPCWIQLSPDENFNDTNYWELPSLESETWEPAEFHFVLPSIKVASKPASPQQVRRREHHVREKPKVVPIPIPPAGRFLPTPSPPPSSNSSPAVPRRQAHRPSVAFKMDTNEDQND